MTKSDKFGNKQIVGGIENSNDSICLHIAAADLHYLDQLL
jgi:hypothetical protein